MRYEIRPISDRTFFTGRHENSPFTAGWSETLDLLDRELYQLDAKDIIFEVDVPESAIRLDGRIRADAKAATPAVRLVFESKHGPLSYATDRYTRPTWRREGAQQDWQHNVRAIALGLEALRKVDQYGITRRGEQYQGWAQIEAGPGATASHMTRDQARDYLLSFMTHPESARHMLPLDQLLKRVRAKTHPDRHGGDRTAWDQVEQAAKVLGVVS